MAEDEKRPPVTKHETADLGDGEIPSRHSSEVAYETGARKRVPEPGPRPDPLDTGDKGDEPKKPYGLTESSQERGNTARHDNGVQPSRNMSHIPDRQ